MGQGKIDRKNIVSGQQSELKVTRTKDTQDNQLIGDAKQEYSWSSIHFNHHVKMKEETADH